MKGTNVYDLYHLHRKEIDRQHYAYARNIRRRHYRNQLRPFLRALDDRIRAKVWPRGKAYLRVMRYLS
ncbi:hypothetical protein D7S44_09785 [Pantoea piersonii]|jgi:hypothetical protein|nr:hypothetical protein D7S44_09785 [Pantoea piersonii]